MPKKHLQINWSLGLDKKLPRFCHQALVGKGWFFKDGSKKSLGGDEWSFGFHGGWLLAKGMAEKRSMDWLVGFVVVVAFVVVGFGW